MPISTVQQDLQPNGQILIIRVENIMNIMWVSPCYYPAHGGWCYYQKIIGEELEIFNDIKWIVVLAEVYSVEVVARKRYTIYKDKEVCNEQ